MVAVRHLQRTVLVGSQKGGVGKSSIVSAAAAMIAATGRKVLVVDADQQANLTESDLGADGDGGRSLAMALQYGTPLDPVRGVRSNLDLVAGGPQLAVVGPAIATQGGSKVHDNLAASLGSLILAERYDLVLIDSGHGDVSLLRVLLQIARYLIVPTKDDDASLHGVELIASLYLQARANGALIQLLGVVLFDANPRAKVRNQDVVSQVADLLRGSGAEPFEAFIRSDKAAAVDLRNEHLTPAELVEAARVDQQQRIRMLRSLDKKPRTRLWSRDPSGLAADYQCLTKEILRRIATAERNRASRAVVS
ncbi:ParA family protein [Skermania sp. ID1734]|uniref:ParA family protein n=1 Tax=Skermania sp. ID1734 TaxID=2597516 RepID=UPI00117D7CE7|nr:ParA family protein [Skermania sp. ID1734]TSD93819.1 ParA family protein [Skermania sp. ID1734]